MFSQIFAQVFNLAFSRTDGPRFWGKFSIFVRTDGRRDLVQFDSKNLKLVLMANLFPRARVTARVECRHRSIRSTRLVFAWLSLLSIAWQKTNKAKNKRNDPK